MCTQLYQDIFREKKIKLQSSFEKTKTQPGMTKQEKKTSPMQEQWKASSVVLHVAVMQGSTGITFDTGLSCSLLHNTLAQPAACTAAAVGAVLSATGIAAVLCENALSHSLGKKGEKNTPLQSVLHK